MSKRAMRRRLRRARLCRHTSRIRAILMCGIITGTLHAGEKTNGPQTRSTSIQIAHITVIEGTGSRPRPDMTVVLSDGVIRYIGPSAAKPPLFGSTTINGRGKFLLPGLIDTHAHVTHLRFVGSGNRRAAVYDDEISVALVSRLDDFNGGAPQGGNARDARTRRHR